MNRLVEQHNRRWWFKLNGLIRWLMVHGAPLTGESKLVLTEYPKSGGTWIGQMVADCLSLPNPRNRLPPRERCLLHGVHRSIASRHDKLIVWRDGRDIMVSFYYHLLIDKPLNAPWQAKEVRQKLGLEDVYDIRENLPRFIEFCFGGGVHPGFSWNRFCEAWLERQDCIHTSYEAMTVDAETELARIVEGIAGAPPADEAVAASVQNYAFEAVANRQRGTEDPTQFVRKGVPGDWRDKFNREARRLFRAYAGEMLIRLGYERDDSWVEPETSDKK
jgi:hypothetical protein